MQVGDPLDERTEVGPLAFRSHYERVTGLVDIARTKGAVVAYGGDRPAGLRTGFYLTPTVLTGLDDQMTVVQTEVFGPVISVLGWTEVDDGVRRANALPLGLTANIWTKDVNAALPFGGWKHSGIGQENGPEELLSYTREKSITITLHGGGPPSQRSCGSCPSSSRAILSTVMRRITSRLRSAPGSGQSTSCAMSRAFSMSFSYQVKRKSSSSRRVRLSVGPCTSARRRSRAVTPKRRASSNDSVMTATWAQRSRLLAVLATCPAPSRPSRWTPLVHGSSTGRIRSNAMPSPRPAG